MDAMRWMAGEKLVLTGAVSTPLGAYISQWIGFPQLAVPVTNLDVLIAGMVFMMLWTISFQTVNVVSFLWHKFASDASKRNAAVRNALLQQCYMWSVIGITALWLHTDATHGILKSRWWMFYGCAGVLLADMTSKLMVAHVADLEWKPFTAGIVLFASAPLLVRFWPFPGWSQQREVSEVILLLSFVISVLDLAGFLHSSVVDIATSLDIDVFDISKQVARARATSVIETAAKAVASPQAVKSAAAAEGVKPFTEAAAAGARGRRKSTAAATAATQGLVASLELARTARASKSPVKAKAARSKSKRR
jgi:hypothetical protein